MLDFLKTRHRGQFAEKLAEQYLLKQGIAIVDRNFSCRQGEIDLIGRDKNGLIFVEVRFRSHQQYGSPCETVDWKKQNKLMIAAQHYLQQHRLTDSTATRFDVIGIKPKSAAIKSQHATDYDIQWIQNAFDLN